MRKLWIFCFVCAVLGSSSASAINTYKYWFGEAIGGFGCTANPRKQIDSTFGQVITIPKGKHILNNFSFWWQRYVSSAHGSMVYRGEVYAWDGSKATGDALYESAPRTFSFTDGAWHEVTFATSLSVTPGAQYIIFASTDKDWKKCKGTYYSAWGTVNNYYPYGTFESQANYGNWNNWTTENWTDGGYHIDLTFKANLSH